MKKTVLALVTLLLTVNSFAIASCPTDSCPIASWPDTFTNILSHENAANDDDWILVGEVVLRNVSPNLKANLYIREVAHKIIYRIEYNGKFYVVVKQLPNDDNDKVYMVTINGKTYHFDVQ